MIMKKWNRVEDLEHFACPVCNNISNMECSECPICHTALLDADSVLPAVKYQYRVMIYRNDSPDGRKYERSVFDDFDEAKLYYKKAVNRRSFHQGVNKIVLESRIVSDWSPVETEEEAFIYRKEIS